MEKALFLKPGSPWPSKGSWDRLYFGSEFCPWMLPTTDEVRTAMEDAKKRGMKFTLVTPYLFDETLKDIEPVMEGISDAKEIEIVFNDYGLLPLMRERGWSFKPVLGRLLIKGSADCRGSNKRSSIIDYRSSGNLESPVFIAFLKGLGVERVEIDKIYPASAENMRKTGVAGGELMSASYHYPYRLITLTTRCPWRFEGKHWETGPCPRHCRDGQFALKREDDGFSLIMRGCAQFARMESIPEGVESYGVNRIVYHPVLGDA